MIFTKNNHLNYWYNEDRSQIFRNSEYDIVSFEFGGISRPVKSFREEAAIAAGEIIELYPNLHIGLTAGIDSNSCLHSFLDIGVKPGIFIVKFLNNLNNFDVDYALNRCKELSIEPVVVELDIGDFVKDKMLGICEEYQVYTMYQSMLMYACKDFDFPFLTVDELEFRRDMHPDHKWAFIKKEDTDMSWRRYASKLNKQALNNFFTWSPELMFSFVDLPMIDEICTDKIPGKLSYNSTKNKIYSSGGFPEVANLRKTFGIEKFEPVFEDANTSIKHFNIQNTGFKPAVFAVEYPTFKNDLSREGNYYRYVV